MMKEKNTYCTSDVTILRQSDMKFRDNFMSLTGIDPLVDAVTIASSCNLEFRKNHLKPNTIGLIPSGGYFRRERQSVIGTK